MQKERKKEEEKSIKYSNGRNDDDISIALEFFIEVFIYLFVCGGCVGGQAGGSVGGSPRSKIWLVRLVRSVSRSVGQSSSRGQVHLWE
ncbi:hypothetical protein BofuT4_P132110.1 [Botrytis cinerea T4]|uniref:Uncharacterized protein n=1 Tax=Botryotinia fuckeliana (strain T4) TaxID=999810 RepID=G2YQY3_BOTF4|nr:hypothetical protein BofuT4_P132110.1 [Botrytis cinerea T4]